MLTNQVRQLIKQRNRYADCYSKQADLIHLIGQRLLERLQLVTIEPDIIIELGSADGLLCRQLKKQYKSAKVIGIEPAVKLAKLANSHNGWFNKQPYLSALPDKLPIIDECADLVIVNLYPVWQADISTLFAEINRILTTDGLILFSSLGPDSLQQVKQSWSVADPNHHHLMPFPDMHDIGDALTRNRYHNIVMENEPLTIEYTSTESLHDDLRKTAHANLDPQRRLSLLGKGTYQTYINAMEQHKNPNLMITYDVVFGHGWKGMKQPKHAINAIPDNFENIPIKSLN